ncbi:GRF1-interacting factor 2 [Cardamine amara subsp. amara]|uniref:GRF1-interacting factor 2 n=1 Tax=Cardamine amara subsp. amara TaxID=228776 RepID=A0ABD1BU27_CARAN
MQQSPQMFPMVPSIPPTSNITTEQIQKYLDENKKLIMAIMENQNLGKLAECAQYQAHLQKNLMYLAAIADAQPPPPTPGAPPAPAMASQMTPHPAMQPPSYFMQHPQASGMGQQASPGGIFPPRGPLQFGSPHQLQDPQQQQIHQQAMQGHMGIRPMGINNNGMHHPMQQVPETGLGGSGPNVGLRGGKQDGGDGQGKDDGK